MRTKIRIDTKYYKLVPWLVIGECIGCVFKKDPNCPNKSDGSFHNKCSEGSEFDKHIFIPATKVGLADYIALKLDHGSENQLDN